MFKSDNSPEMIERIGLRNKQSTRSIVSEEEDRLIVSFQKVHGNKWKLITMLMADMIDTKLSSAQVQQRFIQLEIERRMAAGSITGLIGMLRQIIRSLFSAISG